MLVSPTPQPAAPLAALLVTYTLFVQQYCAACVASLKTDRQTDRQQPWWTGEANHVHCAAERQPVYHRGVSLDWVEHDHGPVNQILTSRLGQLVAEERGVFKKVQRQHRTASWIPDVFLSK